MTSQLQDTPLEQINFADLTEEQLKDIAENDDRPEARDAAQRELTNRESGHSEAAPPPEERGQQPEDAAPDEEPPAAPVTNSLGEETEPRSEEAGAGQVQAVVNAHQTAGHTGTDVENPSPPDTSHTVAGVTGNDALQKIADEGAEHADAAHGDTIVI